MVLNQQDLKELNELVLNQEDLKEQELNLSGTDTQTDTQLALYARILITIFGFLVLVLQFAQPCPSL